MERIVRGLACGAEGVGRRAPARVCEVAPQTGLAWVVEAAEQLQALTSSVLGEGHVHHVHRDAW